MEPSHQPGGMDPQPFPDALPSRQPVAFLAIQCPSCASTDVSLRGGGSYECNHCSTSFVHKQQAQAPPPAPPPPPRPLNVPVNSYGPPQAPTIAPIQIQVTAAPRRTGCMTAIIILFSFAVPLVGVGASFWQSHQATQASQTAAAEAMARVTGVGKPPEAPTQVVPRTSRSALTAPSAPSEEPGEPTAEAAAAAAGEGTSLDTFQKLKGCSCRAKAGAVELHLRAATGGTTITGAGTRRTMELTFAAKAGGGTPFTLPTTSKTAPSNEYAMGRFPLGMGCDGDTLVLAAERSVTAWSISNRTAQWTQTLPESYGDVSPSDTPSLDCKSLTVGSGTVSVRAGGKTVRLDLKSGEPASSRGSKSSSSKPPPAEPKQPETEPAPVEPKPADTKPAPPKTDPKPAPAADGKKKKKKGKKKKKKKGKKK